MTDFAYFREHPLRIAKDQSKVPLERVRQAELSGTTADHIAPISGAYIHYGGVELADRLAIERPSIPEDDYELLCLRWNLSCGQVCRQLLHYVFHIIHREMRHASKGMTEKAFGPDWENNLSAVYVHRLATNGNGYTKVMSDNSISVGDAVAAIEKHYRKGGWGGSYGGVKWADIAKQYRLYITGEASAMIAADRCWTLVHNTGPIFNKGMYFINQNPVTVLNAQAKGSVFDLAMDAFLQDGHPTAENFKLFRDLAEKYLEPKSTATPAGEPKSAEPKRVRFGPYSYLIGEDA